MQYVLLAVDGGSVRVLSVTDDDPRSGTAVAPRAPFMSSPRALPPPAVAPPWHQTGAAWQVEVPEDYFEQFRGSVRSVPPPPPVMRMQIVCDTTARDGDGRIVVTLYDPFRAPVAGDRVFIHDETTGTPSTGVVDVVEQVTDPGDGMTRFDVRLRVERS